MKISRNIKGETLAETIIALSILAIGITIASTIMLNSMRNLTNAKNRVLAVNIAREGIEAMRNIRDTNWLYYSDKRRTCWNHDPSVPSCDGSDPIEPGVYIVYKADDQSWQIADANVGTAPTKLSLVDIDDTIDSDNADGDNLDTTGNSDDFNMYNHKDAIAVDALGAETRTSPFSRYITVEYLENAPSSPTSSIDTPTKWTAADEFLLNRMRITSTVEWERGAIHKAELTTIITDHLGREDLGG